MLHIRPYICAHEVAPRVCHNIVDLTCACVAQAFVISSPTESSSLYDFDMEGIGVTKLTLETKNAELHTYVFIEADGESASMSTKRSSSTLPPQGPRLQRGVEFALVCVDDVEVHTVAGEHMKFNTENKTTRDLRVEVAMWRGVLPSQVQLLCDELEICDKTPILSAYLTAVVRCTPERGQGFAPVCSDAVEIHTIAGEHLGFWTENFATHTTYDPASE